MAATIGLDGNGRASKPASDALAAFGLTDPIDSIRKLINKLIVALIVIATLLAGALLWWRPGSAEANVERDAGNIAEMLAEYLAIRLSPVDAALSRLVATSRRAGGPLGSRSDWSDAIRNGMSGAPGIGSLIVTDARGIVAYSTVLQLRGEDWSTQPIFNELKAASPNLLVAAAPLSVTAGDSVLVPIGRALTNPRREFIGTAIATLVPGQLRDFGESFDLGPGSIAWALLPSGDVLFRQSRTADPNEASAVERPQFAQAGLTESGTTVGPLVADGPDYLTVHRKAPRANMIVAVSVAEADFRKGWGVEAAVTLAVLAVFATGLLVVRARIFRHLADAESDRAAS